MCAGLSRDHGVKGCWRAAAHLASEILALNVVICAQLADRGAQRLVFREQAVHARALEAGVATETLDDAMELDDPKLAIMELIINAACGVA